VNFYFVNPKGKVSRDFSSDIFVQHIYLAAGAANAISVTILDSILAFPNKVKSKGAADGIAEKAYKNRPTV
jgi:hypothetical protein